MGLKIFRAIFSCFQRLVSLKIMASRFVDWVVYLKVLLAVCTVIQRVDESGYSKFNPSVLIL